MIMKNEISKHRFTLLRIFLVHLNNKQESLNHIRMLEKASIHKPTSNITKIVTLCKSQKKVQLHFLCFPPRNYKSKGFAKKKKRKIHSIRIQKNGQHKKTQIPLGPNVRETASASLSIPACNASLHSLPKDIFLEPALTTSFLVICGFWVCGLLQNPDTVCFSPRPCNCNNIH